MEDFKTRLIKEQTELYDKLEKLNNFLDSEKSREIDIIQHSLLTIQAGAMYTYLQCLNERLSRL